MPAHEKAYDRIRRTLILLTSKRTRVRTQQDYTTLTRTIDQYLDEWAQIMYCATEWDANKWGFSDESWMVEERKQMSRVPMVKGRDGRWYEPR